jgi:hypothetical protein
LTESHACRKDRFLVTCKFNSLCTIDLVWKINSQLHFPFFGCCELLKGTTDTYRDQKATINSGIIASSCPVSRKRYQPALSDVHAVHPEQDLQHEDVDLPMTGS